MASIYDSEKIREAARRAHSLAGRISGDVAGLEDRCADDLDAIRGETGRALRERLELLEQQIKRLAYELGGIGDSLSNYASAVEAIGGDLADIMAGR